MNETWMAVTAVGRDRPGIVARVTAALLHLGCNLGETSMARLRGDLRDAGPHRPGADDRDRCVGGQRKRSERGGRH